MKLPVLHQTDIFHPYADLDDHWDLACQFALSYVGKTDLRAIVIDYPPNDNSFQENVGDPAIGAVGQISYITG